MKAVLARKGPGDAFIEARDRMQERWGLTARASLLARSRVGEEEGTFGRNQSPSLAELQMNRNIQSEKA